MTIAEGKFGYLLENPSKAGVFRDSLGFERATLEAALRRHLSDNWERAERVQNPYGGTKIRATGADDRPERRHLDNHHGVEYRC